MDNLFKCKICGREFTIKGKNTHRQALSVHLIQTHNISPEAYYTKFYLNEEVPTCACGCGMKPNFFRWKFYKYYGDHKNKIKYKDKYPEYCRNVSEGQKKTYTLEFRLNKLGYTKDQLTNIYNDFTGLKISFTEIRKIYSLDNRTIKKYWKELGLIDNILSFNRIVKKHQFSGGKKIGEKLKINVDDEILYNIFSFLKEHPNKLTLNEIKVKFDIKVSYLVLWKRLKETFGDHFFRNHIKFVHSSKAEIEFYHILKYYFGNDISKQIQIEGKMFDYMLCNKLLIEFDGVFWHSKEKSKINDKLKDEIAIKNGYEILRIKDTESKNINILNNLNKLYEKFKKI